MDARFNLWLTKNIIPKDDVITHLKKGVCTAVAFYTNDTLLEQLKTTIGQSWEIGKSQAHIHRAMTVQHTA